MTLNIDLEKLIESLLSLISLDYNCELKLCVNSDINGITLFSIVEYQKDHCLQCCCVGEWIYTEFNSLNEMLQIILNPSYELWIHNASPIATKIAVAKEYGLTIDQLALNIDLRLTND